MNKLVSGRTRDKGQLLVSHVDDCLAMVRVEYIQDKQGRYGYMKENWVGSLTLVVAHRKRLVREGVRMVYRHHGWRTA